MKKTWIVAGTLLLSLSAVALPAGVLRQIGGEVVAEGEANFEQRSLQPGFSTQEGSLSGHTGGSYSLAAISNRDINGTACLGFGDSRPDHIVELAAGFSALTFQVESRGKDTALLIQGPQGVLCGEDASAANLDDRIVIEDLEAGRYKIWVGAMQPGSRQNYRLMVQEN